MKDLQNVPKFCSECGAPFNEKSQFCGRCGARLTPPPAAKKTPIKPVRPQGTADASPVDKPMQVLWLLVALIGAGLVLRLIMFAATGGDGFEISLAINGNAYAAARAILLGGSLWFLLHGGKRNWLIGGLALFVWVVMSPMETVLSASRIPFIAFIRVFFRILVFAVVCAAAAGASWHFLFKRQPRDKRALCSAIIALVLEVLLVGIWTLVLYKARKPSGRLAFFTLLQGGVALVSYLGLNWLSRTALKGRMRQTTWGYIWCGLCTAATLGALIQSIRNLSRARYLLTPIDAVFAALLIASFVLLLFGKKSGWFLLLTTALMQVYVNGAHLALAIAEKGFSPTELSSILGAAVNAVVTWFTIRPSWRAAGAAPALAAEPVRTAPAAAAPVAAAPFAAAPAEAPVAAVSPVAAPAAVPASPVAASAPAQAVQGSSVSLRELRCPQCGSYDVIAKGKDGALGKSIGVSLAFGAVGNLVANANASVSEASMEYQCRACKRRFPFTPLQPQPDEMLDTPATVQFTRDGSMVGAAVQQFVFLNGMPVGPVKNGKTLTFTTNLRFNSIFVTDHFGVAYPEMYRFEALPGAVIPVHFNRKFR